MTAAEIEAAAKVIAAARRSADEISSRIDAMPARDQVVPRRFLEMRFAVISMIEAAVAEGLGPHFAVKAARHTAISLLGRLLQLEHAGASCRVCLVLEANEMAALLAANSGFEGSVSVTDGAVVSSMSPRSPYTTH